MGKVPLEGFLSKTGHPPIRISQGFISPKSTTWSPKNNPHCQKKLLLGIGPRKWFLCVNWGELKVFCGELVFQPRFLIPLLRCSAQLMPWSPVVWRFRVIFHFPSTRTRASNQNLVLKLCTQTHEMNSTRWKRNTYSLVGFSLTFIYPGICVPNPMK